MGQAIARRAIPTQALGPGHSPRIERSLQNGGEIAGALACSLRDQAIYAVLRRKIACGADPEPIGTAQRI